MAYSFSGISSNDKTEALAAQTGPLPVEPGWYPARVKEAKPGKFGNSGKNPGLDKISLVLQVTSGQYKGRQFYADIPMAVEWPSSPGTKTLLIPFLTALGTDVESDFEVDPDEMLGEVLDVRVDKRTDTYNGETRIRNNVRGFAPEGAKSDTSSADQVEEFDLAL